MLPGMPALHGLKNNNVALYTTKSTFKGEKRKMRLACKHLGQPVNKDVHDNNDDRETQGPIIFIAKKDGEFIDSPETKVKSAVNCIDSQRIECKFAFVLCPLNVNSQHWDDVSFYTGEHNHDDEKIILDMIRGHTTNGANMLFLTTCLRQQPWINIRKL
ncbi:hypothetical protein BDA99DRAFT_528786 [Phascolomyces articulosus]|uniref:Uncharacterized protein n=1 Tax=Phascolomyces articulosus TaxID=60185 RepID=A0AAD5JLE1_9FUNG|nr:hypothetical protein BDA99DRAFT_528786 [Phascolomyces articulosus]